MLEIVCSMYLATAYSFLFLTIFDAVCVYTVHVTVRFAELESEAHVLLLIWLVSKQKAKDPARDIWADWQDIWAEKNGRLSGENVGLRKFLFCVDLCHILFLCVE